MASSDAVRDWVPSACALPAEEQPLRVADFDALFATALVGIHRLGPTHVRLTLDSAATTPAYVCDLADRETECCSFFAFTVTAGDPLTLDVLVLPAHVAVLAALAERAARVARIAA